jgi:long-subunit fatty acid transport protein
MFFSDRRVRGARACARRAHRPLARVMLATTVIMGFATTVARPAAAAPLDDPFIGGLSFTGPTSGNLAAVYWNPAALGLVRGLQIMVGGTAHLSAIDVERAPIDPETGIPGGLQATGNATTADGFARPSLFGPRSYLAISSDLGGDRFTLAFATYMPWVQQVSYPVSTAGDEPTRYHALKVDLRNLALVPALAIRFGNELRIGLAPGFMFSTGQLSFAEDLALNGGTVGLTDPAACNGVMCNAENPQAAARFNVASGHGLGDAKFSVTLGGGIYWRRRNLEIGLAYQSRPIGSDRGVEVSGQRSSATLPPRDNMGVPLPVTCPGGQTDRCLFGDLSYRLPDVFIAGVTWRLSPGLELSAMVRWLWMHVHDRIDVRLFGPTLDTDKLPQHIVLYRGFQDVWDTRVRVSYWWREQIRIGAAMRVETSAVPTDAVNPAAVDALKLQPMALLEIRIWRRIWLSGGYGITFMPAVNVTNSVFKPEYASGCFDSGGNLATEACQARLDGRARPTAAGRYTATRQDFGLTLTARF